MASVPQKSYSVDEYLALEVTSEIRHEYFAGEIFAMSGSSRAHNRIALNLARLLHNALRGGGCQYYAIDMRVRASKLYTYPDVLVVCGKEEFDGATLLNPKVIFEVLSDSTESYDRGKKFERYREIPSFREYFLVAQDQPHVDRFLSVESHGWTVMDPAVGTEATLEIASLGLRLPLAGIFEGVEFPPPQTPVAQETQ